MPESIATSLKTPWYRALTNSSTATSFPAHIPTITKPATVDNSTATSNILVTPSAGARILLAPFGADSDGDAFYMRVVGWSSVIVDGSTVLWQPLILYQVLCTLGTEAGIAAAAKVVADLSVDTIAEDTTGLTGTTFPTGHAIITYGATNIQAALSVNTEGSELIGVYFDLHTGAASANTLFRFTN